MKKRNHNITIKKILLAAGSSRRYGDKNKLTEKFKGKYLIQHIRDTLLKVFHSSELLVIVGHDYETIKNLINNKDIKIINNKNYKNGIGTSISLGVQNLETNIQGVMIIPADMPLILAEDLIKLFNKNILNLDASLPLFLIKLFSNNFCFAVTLEIYSAPGTYQSFFL